MQTFAELVETWEKWLAEPTTEASLECGQDGWMLVVRNSDARLERKWLLT